MALVFCKQRFDFVRKTTIEKLKKKHSKNPNTVKGMSFWLRHLNEQGYKFSMITTGISRHVRYLLEKKGVRLLSLSLLSSEALC